MRGVSHRRSDGEIRVAHPEVDDVADVHLEHVAVIVLDLQLAGVADPDCSADEVAARPLDAHAAPKRRQPQPVLADHAREVGVTPVELGQEGSEQLAPVDGVAGLEIAGGRGLGELGRELVPLDVHSRTDDHGVAVALGEDPDQLAVPDDEVVRPLQPGREPGDARDGIHHGDAAGHRDERRLLRRERRPQQHGDEKRRPRRRHPSPPSPAAPRGLEVGDGHQALGRTTTRLVEQVTVRRVEGVEPPNLVRRFDRLALGHRP